MTRCTCFILGVLLAFAKISAQNVDSTLALYEKGFQQERLYFHFDKSAYFPGDTIWYKAYVMAGFNASAISKNVYTDWLDASNNLILHGVAPIVFSSAYGQIVIPENYTADVFHLHAYTGWMLNFDSSFLFDKDIPVIQPTGQGNSPIPLHNVQVSVMPEGGNLVQSLLSIVAFKANNQSGRPVAITGAIKNQQGDVLDSVFAVHDGMGRFFITPTPGDIYSLHWRDAEGDTGTAPIPTALPTGAVLKVSVSENKIGFHVDRCTGAPVSFKKMYLVATAQQAEAFKLVIDLDKVTDATGSIPISQLPTGIVQLTLFNAYWQPIAERIVFVNNNDYTFTAGINIDKKNINKRGANEIEINVPGSIAANLSIAVTDASLIYDTSYNIISHLLLTSDVKGYINNPAYYFSSQSDSVKQALDLVMLTSGWRRYRWDDVTAGRLPAIKYTKDTSFITISGKVNVPGRATIGDSTFITLNIRSAQRADSIHIFTLLPVNADGSFSLLPGFFSDSLQVYYNLTSNRKTERHGNTVFTSSLLPPLPDYHYIKTIPSKYGDSLALLNSLALKAKADELARLIKQTTLKNVTVKAIEKSKLKKVDDYYTSSVFSGNLGNNYSFDVAADPSSKGLYTLGMYLTAKVPGLSTTIRGTPPATYYTYHLRGVQLYLQESQVTEDILETIPLGDVAYVKFFRRGGLVLAENEAAIAVYLRGSDTTNTLTVLKYAVIPGFTVAKEFYNPAYPEGIMAAQEADVRTTLYWNPYILTNAGKHSAKITFYNNDISKRLRIIMEGINGEGKLVRMEKIIE